MILASVLDSLKTDVADLKMDVRGLQTSVETMRDDMNTMKTELKPLVDMKRYISGQVAKYTRTRIPRRALGFTRTQHDALNGIFKYPVMLIYNYR